MSIIQNIRERGTWIIFGIITIALIAFILQDGVGRKGGNDISIQWANATTGWKIQTSPKFCASVVTFTCSAFQHIRVA